MNQNIHLHINSISEKAERLIKELTALKNENENLELNIAKILKRKRWSSNYGWMYITFKEPCHNTVFLSSEYKDSLIFNHAF